MKCQYIRKKYKVFIPARANKMLQTQQFGARACSPREFALQREKNTR